MALFLIGVGLISSVTWPMIQWQVSSSIRRPEEKFISPVSAAGVDIDYLAARNWYPAQNKNVASASAISYKLSIPKLRITSAIVSMENDDLKKNLVGWRDAGVPGQPGTAIIFGHSALPQFYDPKSYVTIFSLLPTLSLGDSIYVNYDGVAYKYKVYNIQTLAADDFTVLEQKFDDSYLSLVTCVPPGTYWKRLLVRAMLVNY